MNTPTNHLIRTERDHLTFFYDIRSQKLEEIEKFLREDTVEKLQKYIQDHTYVVLGGDGLMVQVAKMAHVDMVDVLGINFGTKGFLLHDRKVFEQDDLYFEKQEYPILHADIQKGDTHTHGYAFNELFISREPTAGSLKLSVSHSDTELNKFSADGMIVSTPAGSTGWNKEYRGVVLYHKSGQNAVTFFGNAALMPFALPDKGRIRIKNDATRNNPLYILADNRPIIRDERQEVLITIERATRGVNLLIESSYRPIWDKKPFQELGFS